MNTIDPYCEPDARGFVACPHCRARKSPEPIEAHPFEKEIDAMAKSAGNWRDRLLAKLLRR